VRLTVVPGLPEIAPGDPLPDMLADAVAAAGGAPGDIVVVAQKVVSKAEGRLVRLTDVRPGPAAELLSEETGRDPVMCELILSESRRIVRRRNATLICETRHGFICANAGIDASNVRHGHVVLLPVDPDRSARHLQSAISARVGGRVGVVVTDTHGRAFRRGIINVAIGVAGFRPVVDHRGGFDREGRMLIATEQALADELAAAGGILMDKGGGLPVVIISGVETSPAPGGVGALLRSATHDLFRGV